MAILPVPARRIIVAGGFAFAVALAPAAALLSGALHENVVAACPPGEDEDPYTYACVPHTVPGAGIPGGVGGNTGAPSETELTQCSGRDQGNCVEQNLYGSPGATPGISVPNVDNTVHQSP